MRIRPLSLALCSFLALSGCSGLGSREDIGPTLADLQPARMPDRSRAVPSIPLDDIEASYHRALDIADDDAVRRKILVRLAGLEMIRSEQNQLDASGGDRYFDRAVRMYRELIELQRGEPGRDQLMYQLAKAYAMDGRSEESSRVLDQLASEYPDSPLIAEAQFRRAERAFNNGDYAAAEDYYRAVIEEGDQSPFADNALYMQGWSQFKRNQYPQALRTFTRVLDEIQQTQADLQSGRGAQKNLVDDTLRVMSLAFSYLDGAESIRGTYAELGPRPYIHLLYQRLGELYLETRRYRSSAETYAHYVENHPDSDHAPGFSIRIVEVYDEADFPSLLLPAKEDFVSRYGVRSDYWAQKPASIRDTLRPYLHEYLQELATYFHARAQSLSAADSNTTQAYYRQAALWYEEFVESFPADDKTPEMLFLLGETYNESGELPKAIDTYEKVAYEIVDPQRGAQAGYAAILATGEVIDSLPVEQRDVWRRHRTESYLNFSDYYPHDERAPAVLARAAQDLLGAGRYDEAIAAASRLGSWQSPMDESLRKTAWLIQGQAHFELQNYLDAEQAYRQALALTPAPTTGGGAQAVAEDGPSRDDLVERIAASMFRQAEQQLAANAKAAAVDILLRVAEFAPGTSIAASADYDAASYMMDLQQWRRAGEQLVAFRRNYPDHELAQDVPAKLVVVYREQEAWDAAARELRLLAANGKDPEQRRQSLITAAEYFERGGAINAAILAYRDYANNYAEPFDETLEAANKLVALYGQSGDGDKRDFWQRKLIALDANAGAARSGRSRFLAARATSELADGLYRNFASIKLTLPLHDSLSRKRKALEETLLAYQRVLDYQVAEFTTEASFRIGEVYVQLSRALMESERPKNLDDLALEQYEILLEEQAFPFEERAIEVLEANARRSWDGIYDQWVRESFERLASLLPARYRKEEQVADFSHAIH